jgi:uncharacterized protein (TIGR02265 family)
MNASLMPKPSRGLFPPGVLHPARLIATAGGSALAGRVRRWAVRRLYQHLAMAYPLEAWTTMNYGYAPLPGEAAPAVAVPADAAERNGLQLYARVASSGRRGAELAGLDVLEVGGAAFIATTTRPRRMTGLDIAPAAAALASTR